jgi:hypothetical protein
VPDSKEPAIPTFRHFTSATKKPHVLHGLTIKASAKLFVELANGIVRRKASDGAMIGPGAKVYGHDFADAVRYWEVQNPTKAKAKIPEPPKPTMVKGTLDAQHAKEIHEAHLASKSSPSTATGEGLVALANEVKASKTAKASKANGNGETKVKFPNAQRSASVITILVDENPKKKGGAPYDRFALYENGMTVTEFLKAGGLPIDVDWDVAHKFIALSDAGDAPMVRTKKAKGNKASKPANTPKANATKSGKASNNKASKK